MLLQQEAGHHSKPPGVRREQIPIELELVRREPGAGSGPGHAGSMPTRGTISRACHDLRQPVATILMLAAAASMEPGVPPRVRHYLDEITGQATWISDMVHELVHQGAPAQPEEVNVVSVIRQVAAMAAASGIRTSISVIAGRSARVSVDRILVGRAIANLVDNAVRAAGPEGEVCLTVRSRSRDVVIIVEDNGPGFGEAPGGTGLGLSMTAFVASTCGGRLALQASPLGGGHVALTLPRRPHRTDTGA